MPTHLWPRSRAFFTCVYLLSVAGKHVRADNNHHEHDEDLFHFRTRPELKAPKWEVTVHNEELLSDGYWFVGVKPSLDKTIGTGQGWFGPHIYDERGELIWSGSAQFDTSNVMDFRMSNVNGKECLTVLDRDRHIGVVLDHHYEIVDTFELNPGEDSVNGHELKYTDDGKSVLAIMEDKRDAPQDESDQVGYTGEGTCGANYQGFREFDATDEYKSIFDWWGYGHIRLNESTMVDSDVNDRCNNWDFLHANSVDKCPDGDYVLSGRHTSTIYKVSHEDGSIIWRLSGNETQTDFDMQELMFSRQHDIRCHGQNDTHTIISFLDNASGQDSNEPTHEFSRGLLLAVGTESDDMTVTVVQHYDHPYKDGGQAIAQRRGNLQLLKNRNVLMGWSEQALQSEHTEDGEILIEAYLKADWIGSYRNYKFPYVGKPLTKPDVYAVSYFEQEEHEHTPNTEVAVSWNGDTEVRTWVLYGTTEQSGRKESMREIASSNRTSFETRFEEEGYLTSVRLEGLDKDGERIADSGEVKTVQHPSPPPDDDFKDYADGKDHTDWRAEWIEKQNTFLGNPSVTFALLFILGLVLSAVAVLLGWLGYLPIRWLAERSRGLNMGKLRDAIQYKKVAEDEDDDAEQGHPLTNGHYTNGNGKIRLDSLDPP